MITLLSDPPTQGGSQEKRWKTQGIPETDEMQETMTVSQYVMGLRYQSLLTNIPARDCNEQHKRIGLITQGGGREENDIHQAQGNNKK